MLEQAVSLENGELEERRVRLVKKIIEDRASLQFLEDDVLSTLQSTSVEKILQDSEDMLINKLGNSKHVAREIAGRVLESRRAQEQIALAREVFRPLALVAAQLYFCVDDLQSIDAMYHFSLNWFT
jgi:dynein heavy chain